jgi:hypothetical protein
LLASRLDEPPHAKDQEMNNLSASGIIMSTQVASEISGRTIGVPFHDSCSDIGIDLLRRLVCWIRAVRVALG